ncbi:unnamed protein product [Ambrosiozyma monospora]|uniref:Unnamed protein product n=1 Tax=Ambrosiozyma monospora TaxID=43982 RepID=A0ACB5TD90_AMBMO|nr:unnamed protein product [Ambrosiozyma monospora]
MNGSVDEFFRSFSFSQRRTSSFGSVPIAPGSPSLSQSQNHHYSSSYSGTSSMNTSTITQAHHYSASVSGVSSTSMNTSNGNGSLTNLLAPAAPSSPMTKMTRTSTAEKKNFSVLSTNDPIPEETEDSSTLAEEDEDVFVDAPGSPGPVPFPDNPDESLPLLATTPPPKEKQQNPSIASVTNPTNPPQQVPLSRSSNSSFPYRTNSMTRRESTISNQSYQSILNDFDSIISIKIADLGNACWTNLHYTNDIQTRQYRSPETILGGRWGCSTDLWSCACLIFELITGDYLFNPKTGSTYNKNDDHLAMIIELLQIWPNKDFLKRCRYGRDFFDKSYQSFRNISRLKIWTLNEVLLDEYRLGEDEALEISKFLLCMLEFEPKRRVDAGSLSNSPWLADVLPDESIDRVFGLRGQDIAGYSCECHSSIDCDDDV